MKKHVFLTLSLFLIVLCSTPIVSAKFANTSPIQLPAMQDAYITSGYGANNGGTGLMKVDFNDIVGWSRSLVQFDVSCLPKGALVNSATLILQITGCTSESLENTKLCSIYQVTSEWSEYEVTYNERQEAVPWTVIGGGGDYKLEDGVSTTIPFAIGYHQVDVTEIVKNWIEDGEANYGFLIKADNESPPAWYLQFATREYVGEAYRPILEIEWEDAPSRTQRGRVHGVCSYVIQGGISDSGETLQIQLKNLQKSESIEVEITYNIRGNPATLWSGSPITVLKKSSWEDTTTADSTESFSVGDVVYVELIIDDTYTIFESVLISSQTLH